MSDLLDGVPSIEYPAHNRRCPRCDADIPVGLLSCEKCAVAALPPEAHVRLALLLRYRTASKAVVTAEARLATVRAELANGCQHEIVARPEVGDSYCEFCRCRIG